MKPGTVIVVWAHPATGEVSAIELRMTGIDITNGPGPTKVTVEGSFLHSGTDLQL